MNYFDNEEKIIEVFQSSLMSEVYFPIMTENAISVFQSIYNCRKWKKWINNSSKSSLPPDFYSNKFGMMMEVMRVDDHAHYTDKGVLINPTNQRESVLQREIREKILAQNPEIDLTRIDIHVNALSGLSSNEDHNYKFYSANFKRVLKKHIDNIPTYRINHPDKKLIFFVLDESTGYLLVEDEKLAERGPVALEFFKADPLWHFADKNFIDVFQHSDIDYLIWYTPYKVFHGSRIQPPKVCVFDMKQYIFNNVVEYPEKHIISSEA